MSLMPVFLQNPPPSDNSGFCIADLFAFIYLTFSFSVGGQLTKRVTIHSHVKLKQTNYIRSKRSKEVRFVSFDSFLSSSVKTQGTDS